MKALSVRQPYADLIASGRKTVELRSRATHHRGPLLICSSKTPSEGLHFPENALLGFALCVVDLVGCEPFTLLHGPSSAVPADRLAGRGGFAWVLRNARPVVSFPVRGQVVLWDVPDNKIHLALGAGFLTG